MKKSNLILICSLLVSISLNAQWQQANGTSEKKVTSFTSNTSNLFAGTFDGVLISANGGLNWATTGMTSDVFAMIVVGDRIFAANESNGLAVSLDEGENWSASNSGISAGLVISSFTSNTEHIFLGTNNGVFMSGIDGANWEDISNSLPNIDITAVTANDNSVVTGSYGGGIFSSLNNGGSWIAFNQGLSDLNVTCFDADYDNGIMFAGTSSGIFRFTLDNPGWTLVSDGLTNTEVNCILVMGSVICAGTQNGGLFASFDAGDSWISFSNGLPASNINAIYANETNLLVGTETHGVWMRPLTEFSSIDDNNLQDAATIYPNPVYDKLTIENLGNEENLRYKIINPIGQTILIGNINEKIQINTSDLNQGIYFLQIEHDLQIETLKFFKN